MDLKLPIYQWVVTLIPGIATLTAILFVLHFFLLNISFPAFTDSLKVIVFLISALVTGELVSALSSLLQPYYFLSWGGSSAERALSGKEIHDKAKFLCEHFGCDESKVFEEAMTFANKHNFGRVEYFNMSYGYIRSLLTSTLLVLILTLSLWMWTGQRHPFLMTVEIVVLFVFWVRAKQKGLYYAQEVINQSHLHIKHHAS